MIPRVLLQIPIHALNIISSNFNHTHFGVNSCFIKYTTNDLYISKFSAEKPFRSANFMTKGEFCMLLLFVVSLTLQEDINQTISRTASLKVH